jgi:uroporphyrinogen decarboxylase
VASIPSRERVLTSINFETPDRVPKDLGGMLSTGISTFAYPRLVEALGLPPRLPKVVDTGQMLALPDLDVLDALGCDVVTIVGGATNAFEQPQRWHPYDFNARLPAMVQYPKRFRTDPDGTIVQSAGGDSTPSRMPPSAYTFDTPHAGQELNLTDELPKYDLQAYARELRQKELRDEEIKTIATLCRQVREATDRAIFFNEGAISPSICIHGHGGLAVFPILCLLEPDYVAELHEIATEYALRNIRALLPEIGLNVDIIMMAADDWGNQQSLMAPPRVYRDLFLPYRRRLNEAVHELAPGAKTFLHSCGAIYDLIPMIAESGFDIVNPVQWSAGKHSYRDWKDASRGKIALWGGGVNSQATLPLGTVEEVETEVREAVGYLGDGGGYVFCNIHNILAEIPPAKVIAMYRAASAELRS